MADDPIPSSQETSHGRSRYIVAATRTAGGRKGGKLAGWHPADLAGQVLDTLLDRTGADPALVEDVIMGCVSQVGEQAINVARNAVLASRLPESVPGTSVDRQCGSSQQALHFAAQAVMSGTQDIVIAAGVESMTRVPMGLSVALPAQNGFGNPDEPAHAGALSQHPVQPVHGRRDDGREVQPDQGSARRVRLRQPPDAPSRRRRAARSRTRSSPIKIKDAEGDESHAHGRRRHPLRRQRWTAIKGVKLLREGGAITAATSSQICDGASGVMVVNEKGLKALGVDADRPHPPRDGDRRRSGDHAGSPAARRPSAR